MVDSKWVSSWCSLGVQNYWNYTQLSSDTQIYIFPHHKLHSILTQRTVLFNSPFGLWDWWEICLHADNTHADKTVHCSLSIQSMKQDPAIILDRCVSSHLQTWHLPNEKIQHLWNKALKLCTSETEIQQFFHGNMVASQDGKQKRDGMSKSFKYGFGKR